MKKPPVHNRKETKGGVTIQIAAEILGVSPNTLRNWDRSGKLKPRRARNGYRYYSIRDLESFKKKNGRRRGTRHP